MLTNSTKILLAALPYIGVKEDPTGFNPIIKIWIQNSCKSLGLAQPNDDSQFAWCGCFLSNMLIEAGVWPIDQPHIVAARSWLNVGQPVQIPELGDIVILERGPGKGHVGIYLSQTADKYYLLSGNTSDSVTVWPFDKSRLLGIRRF